LFHEKMYEARMFFVDKLIAYRKEKDKRI
jgi:hypothetical protein